MKSEMPYRGLTAPQMRVLFREIIGAYPPGSFAEWEQTIRALWDAAAYREERYAALALVGDRHSGAFRTLEAVPLYEYLIASGAWWDLVDGLATHQVGDLLRRYPDEMRARVLAWSRCADPWLRRTAIICQVGFKQATDQSLLYACIEPNLTQRGFFLRKAIGWALREYAKAAPEAVREYVDEHESRLSGLSRREALKHLGRTRDASRELPGVMAELQFVSASG
jgi:3-methyladenine DNA glycosylase AlkD